MSQNNNLQLFSKLVQIVEKQQFNASDDPIYTNKGLYGTN